jgi:hypothetical protein
MESGGLRFGGGATRFAAWDSCLAYAPCRLRRRSEFRDASGANLEDDSCRHLRIGKRPERAHCPKSRSGGLYEGVPIGSGAGHIRVSPHPGHPALAVPSPWSPVHGQRDRGVQFHPQSVSGGNISERSMPGRDDALNRLRQQSPARPARSARLSQEETLRGRNCDSRSVPYVHDGDSVNHPVAALDEKQPVIELFLQAAVELVVRL